MEKKLKFLLAILLSFVILLCLSARFLNLLEDLRYKEITYKIGYCFSAPLPSPLVKGIFVLPSDEKFSLLLYEDGKILPKGQASLEDVCRKGKGRYCRRGNRLYFSTSDNLSPGRHRYVMEYPLVVSPYLIMFLVFILLVLLAFSRLELAALNQKILNSPLNTALVIAVFLFLGTLLLRLAFYCIWPNFSGDGVSVMGIPYSDARGWDMMAKSIARGRGMIPSWSARRPFYAIFLACFYTWSFPSSFFLAKLLNIVLASITVSLVYLIAERVWNRPVGIFTALAVVFNEIYFRYSFYLLTETLGVFLFVLSIYLMLGGIKSSKKKLLFWAGISFVLSNLTRTLTILAFPAYLLCIFYLIRPEKYILREKLKYLAAFTFGVILTISPWLVRQKLVHGIFAISDNSASGLYAATSPKYKMWSSEVNQEADIEGIPRKIGTRYHYFMQGAFSNLQKYPGFYLKNVGKSFFLYLNALNLKYSNAVFVLLVIFIFFWNHRREWSKKKSAQMLLVLMGILLLNNFVMYYSLSWLVVVAGMFFSCNARCRGSSILIASILFTGLGCAMFAIAGGLDRMALMVLWAFYGFYFYAFFFMMQWSMHGLILKNDFSLSLTFADFPSPRLRSESQIAKVIYGMVLALLIFFTVSGVRLVWLNYLSPPKSDSNISLDMEEKRNIVKKLRKLLPSTFSESEIIVENAFDYKLTKPGKLLVRREKISEYLYYFPPGETIFHWSSIFSQPRNYPRSIFLYDDYIAIFSGAIPKKLMGKSIVLVGRMAGNVRGKSSRIIIEVIAIIPQDPKTGQLDFNCILAAE